MLKLLGTLIVAIFGWSYGQPPPTDQKKLVVIAAPHTSNWDYVLMMAFVWHWGLKINWMGKDSLFDGPLGWLLKLTGGVSIDRSKSDNRVDAMAATFSDREHLWLVIPAAGTRGHRDYWKSGFYYIALAAGVPIAPAVLDYDKKEACFPGLIVPTGDVSADMDKIREIYEGRGAKHPEKKSRIRLRVEDEQSSAPSED